MGVSSTWRAKEYEMYLLIDNVGGQNDVTWAVQYMVVTGEHFNYVREDMGGVLRH